MLDAIKQTDLCITGVSEEAEKEKVAERLWGKVMAVNFPKLMKYMISKLKNSANATQDKYANTHTETNPNKLSGQRQRQNLKAARGMWFITYKESSRRLSGKFSAKTLKGRRQWYDILKVLKEKK